MAARTTRLAGALGGGFGGSSLGCARRRKARAETPSRRGGGIYMGRRKLNEGFSDRATKMLQLAYQVALRKKSSAIGVEHLMVAVFEPQSPVVEIVRDCVRRRLMHIGDLDGLIPKGFTSLADREVPTSPHLVEVIQQAQSEASSHGRSLVQPIDVLVALLLSKHPIVASMLPDPIEAVTTLRELAA